MHNTEKIKDLVNERIGKIFNIEQTEYISSENKITGVKFNFNQSSKDLNNTIVELLNFYIVPTFVLPSDQKNKCVSVRIGKRQETFIVKKYIRRKNTYIESKQLKQQSESGNWLQKKLQQTKKILQDLINGEEVEFIEIDIDNLNFQISSNESTEVEVTFAESEINIEHIESILNCVSKFKELTNNNIIKSLIEVNCDHPVAESQNKLSIYPFFAKRTARYLSDDDVSGEDNIKYQEVVLCLTTKQNDAVLVSSILGNNASQLKVKCKENEYSLLSYSLDNPFSQQSIVDFLLFFNDPSHNGEAQISNLQRIAKIFSEKAKSDQQDIEENSNNEISIRIENTNCFASFLHYEGGNLQLKKSSSGEKIYFTFEVGIENDLDQIEKESKFIYDSMIYKIVSLTSFFALCFNEFSISAKADEENIFSIKKKSYSKPNSYLELAPNIGKKLREHAVLTFINQENKSRSQHIQVLDLFRTKKVKFKLEAQEIAINRLKDIEDLMSGISILNSCKKEFLDNISNLSVCCYLSNFLHENNNLSCVYVITHLENLSINNQLSDKNSGIDLVQNELQKSFECISNSLKQIQKEENFSVYSVEINIGKLLNQLTNKLQEEEVIEVTEETEITGEEVKSEPQKYIEYDVSWQEECFAKPANNYTSLEEGLEEVCKFIHQRILHVCGQLLEEINTLQCGKEQKVEQNDQLFDESTIQATLNDNISNFNKFINEKFKKFEDIKPNFDLGQKKTIANVGKSILDAVQRYREVVKIHLFINKNANDLQKILEKNVEELEQLISDIQMSKIDQMIDEINRFAEESTQSDSTIEQTEANDTAICSTEGSQGAELSNAENGDIQENNNLSSELQIESDAKQENEITPDYIFTLFSELSNKLNEWENLDQNSQERTTSNDQKKSLFYLFNCLTSKITYLIKLKEKNADVEQTQTSKQYRQILNLVNNIFYSAKILHYYKIQNGFEKLEIEIHNIEGITHDYLKKELDKKEEELKIREVQLEQIANVRKIGSDIIVSAAQGVVSLYKKAKNTINSPQQPQNSNVQNTEHLNNSFYSQGNYYTNNYSYQQPDYSQYNIGYHSEIENQSNNFIIDSTYNHKRSNLQKLKLGIKSAFSEKENYAFLTFSILGAAGILAYFVPEGLRKFVPSEKLNIVDITVAICATALIVICLGALVYSVYTNIVHSNMINSTVSSHNQNLSTTNSINI